MLIRHASDILPSEITAPAIHAGRRHFVRNLLAAGAGISLGPLASASTAEAPPFGTPKASPFSQSDEKPTAFKSITS